jgi:hypothetical protein
MPKSKTRRKNKSIRRQAPRPVGMTHAPMAMRRPTRIWTVPAAIGLAPKDIKTVALNASGDRWELPASPAPVLRLHDPAALDAYESKQTALAIAAGMRADVLDAVSEHTISVLEECSPLTGRREETFAELFSHGDLDITMPNSDLVEWLDEMYLGTWTDPSWAVGVFLRDITGTHTISDAVRKTAYERLYAYLPVRELRLKSGRIIVSLEKPMNEDERFLINQFMLHNQIPEVFWF